MSDYVDPAGWYANQEAYVRDSGGDYEFDDHVVVIDSPAEVTEIDGFPSHPPGTPIKEPQKLRRANRVKDYIRRTVLPVLQWLTDNDPQNRPLWRTMTNRVKRDYDLRVTRNSNITALTRGYGGDNWRWVLEHAASNGYTL